MLFSFSDIFSDKLRPMVLRQASSLGLNVKTRLSYEIGEVWSDAHNLLVTTWQK